MGSANFFMFVGIFGCCASAFAIDCNKAKSDREMTICANPQLLKLDEQLNTAFARARSVGGQDVVRAQKDWLKKLGCLGTKEKVTECVKKEYTDRIAMLDQIKPLADKGKQNNGITYKTIVKSEPYEISIRYPVLGTALSPQIKKINQMLNAQATEFICDCDQTSGDVDCSNYEANMDMSATIERIRSVEFLKISREVWSRCGGTHGISNSDHFFVDLKSGEKIDLVEIDDKKREALKTEFLKRLDADELEGCDQSFDELLYNAEPIDNGTRIEFTLMGTGPATWLCSGRGFDLALNKAKQYLKSDSLLLKMAATK